jgi:glutamate synthase (NADPH) small chain
VFSPPEPVAIGAVEKFLQEYALREGMYAAPPFPPNGLKVAVVGSGPGGLVCAEDLLRLGYAVTVFEASSVPGGLLMRGMPAFKLAKSVVERRIDLMRERGVAFRLGVKVCEDVSLEDLLKEFNAVYLAIGARQARRLEVPGAELDGVHQAVPFIVQFSSMVGGEVPSINPDGKRVVVLGGGDTAMDCLRTAIRGGAKEATALYRRDEASMPATRKHYRNAVEEGAQFEFEVAPVAIVGDEQGRVKAVRCVRTRRSAEAGEGVESVDPVPGSEFELSADLVLVAFGFDRAPCPAGSDCAALARNADGDLVVDERQMTSRLGIFAGGDLVHGPGRLVDTVRDARKGAKSIHLYLSTRAETVGAGKGC